MRLYDPVFYKDNFENAGAEKKKRINSAENKSRSESERQCTFYSQPERSVLNRTPV